MSEIANDEGVAALLGMIIHCHGEDFIIPEYRLNEGLPPNSKVAAWWEGSNLRVGIREIGWEPEE